MKALVAHQFGPVDALTIDDTPVPVAGPHEILIDVAAAAINFPDVLVIEGRYQVKPPLPFVPGKELAGVVAAVGAQVVGFQVGDRVMALVEYGAFSEKVAVRSSLCFKVPRAVPLVHAAGIGLAYQTAHFALHHRGNLRAGETVLVTAANGSVGLAAMQLAKAAGANVIGVVNGESKKDIVLENGADSAAVFNDDIDPKEFRAAVKELGGSRGVNLLVDSAGGSTFENCLRTVGWEGRAIIVGFTTGEIPALRTNYLLIKNIAALGLQWSDYRERDPELVSRVQQEIFSLFEQGKLKFQLMGSYPFSEFREAFRALAGRRTRGKIVLEFGPTPVS